MLVQPACRRSGHDLGRGTATDLAGIVAEGDIADRVESVLDAPMAADVAQQRGGGDRRVQTRDAVAHLARDGPRARGHAFDFADLVCAWPIQVAAQRGRCPEVAHLVAVAVAITLGGCGEHLARWRRSAYIAATGCFLGKALLRGDEAVGFTAAFLGAGAHVVLAPLWAVDDAATADLSIAYHTALLGANGTPPRDPASAMRHAINAVRSNPAYAHPFFWAAFSPAGDPAAMLL